MGRVRGITKQDHIMMLPIFSFERGETDPLRVVRQQLHAAKMFSEQALTVGKTLHFVSLVQPGVEPGRLVTLHQKGAGRAVERVGMHLEQTMLIFAENKGESIEHFIRSQPDISGLAVLDSGFKMLIIALARNAIYAICCDEQIIIVKLCEIVNLLAEAQGDTHFTAASLQYIEQRFARYARNDMPAAAHSFAAIMHINSIPYDKLVGDLFI